MKEAKPGQALYWENSRHLAPTTEVKHVLEMSFWAEGHEVEVQRAVVLSPVTFKVVNGDWEEQPADTDDDNHVGAIFGVADAVGNKHFVYGDVFAASAIVDLVHKAELYDLSQIGNKDTH